MVARVESKLEELLDMLELSWRHLNMINDYQLPDEVMLKDDMLLLNEKLSNKLLFYTVVNRVTDQSVTGAQSESITC